MADEYTDKVTRWCELKSTIVKLLNLSPFVIRWVLGVVARAP